MVTARCDRLSQGNGLDARFGGDEFAIIQTVLDEPQDAAALANRVQEALKAPYDLGGLQAVTGVSIGISFAPRTAMHRTN